MGVFFCEVSANAETKKQKVPLCVSAFTETDQGSSELGSLQPLAARVASVQLWSQSDEAFCKS